MPRRANRLSVPRFLHPFFVFFKPHIHLCECGTISVLAFRLFIIVSSLNVTGQST